MDHPTASRSCGSRRSARTATTGLCLLVASCGRSSVDTAQRPTAGDVAGANPPAASATASPSAPVVVEALAPEPAARDADQRFLRQMLDHHERIIRLVHERVSAPAAHREHETPEGPLATDVRLDVEKLEMIALLKALYRDEHSPRPLGSPDSAAHLARENGESAASEGDTSTSARSHRIYRETLADGLRHGVALIDEWRPSLRRVTIRALANRLRQTQLVLLREIAGS